MTTSSGPKISKVVRTDSTYETSTHIDVVGTVDDRYLDRSEWLEHHDEVSANIYRITEQLQHSSSDVFCHTIFINFWRCASQGSASTVSRPCVSVQFCNSTFRMHQIIATAINRAKFVF